MCKKKGAVVGLTESQWKEKLKSEKYDLSCKFPVMLLLTLFGSAGGLLESDLDNYSSPAEKKNACTSFSTSGCHQLNMKIKWQGIPGDACLLYVFN